MSNQSNQNKPSWQEVQGLSWIFYEDLIKYLARYSTMFERNAPYSFDRINMYDGIDKEYFDRCVKELLEKNPKGIENEHTSLR